MVFGTSHWPMYPAFVQVPEPLARQNGSSRPDLYPCMSVADGLKPP